MPFSVSYNDDAGRFEAELLGKIETADLVELDARILASEHWGDGKPRLVELSYESDISGFTLENFQNEFMPVMEASAEKRTARCKAAWIVPRELHLPMVRLWELFPDKDKFESFAAFETRREAISWLETP